VVIERVKKRLADPEEALRLFNYAVVYVMLIAALLIAAFCAEGCLSFAVALIASIGLQSLRKLERERKLMSARDNILKLPPECFIVLRGNEVGRRIGKAKAGETGYYLLSEPAVLLTASIAEVDQFVNSLNEEDGVTLEQRLAMEHGSMFGWETAGADPEHKITKLMAARLRNDVSVVGVNK
jgi:hypothetical protein